MNQNSTMNDNKITQKEEEINIDGATIEAQDLPYFQAPNSIIDIEQAFTAYEKLTYLILCRYGNRGRVAFPSYNTIARKGEFSRDTAKRAVKGLVNKGCIIKENTQHESGGYSSNNYKVIYDIKGVGAHSPQGGCSQPRGVGAGSTSINNDLINEIAEEAGNDSAAPSINNQKAKAVVNMYIEQLKKKGLVPVHNEQKMMKQFAASPLAAAPEKQVIGKMKSWFKVADDYTVKQGFPLGLFVKDYNSVEKPPRVFAGKCDKCNGPVYEDEDHTCKHIVLCEKCDVAIRYRGEKRDAEILEEHQCDPEQLEYKQSFSPVDPEALRRRKLKEAEDEKWRGVKRIES